MGPNPTETTAQLHLMQKGGPFEIARVPKRAPAPDQLLIRQHATALNGLDLKQRDTGLFISRWPHVLGIEGAGVVEAVGSDVRDFPAWRRDYGMYGWQSARRGLGRLVPRACQYTRLLLCG